MDSEDKNLNNAQEEHDQDNQDSEIESKLQKSSNTFELGKRANDKRAFPDDYDDEVYKEGQFSKSYTNYNNISFNNNSKISQFTNHKKRFKASNIMAVFVNFKKLIFIFILLFGYITNFSIFNLIYFLIGIGFAYKYQDNSKEDISFKKYLAYICLFFCFCFLICRIVLYILYFNNTPSKELQNFLLTLGCIFIKKYDFPSLVLSFTFDAIVLIYCFIYLFTCMSYNENVDCREAKKMKVKLSQSKLTFLYLILHLIYYSLLIINISFTAIFYSIFIHIGLILKIFNKSDKYNSFIFKMLQVCSFLHLFLTDIFNTYYFRKLIDIKVVKNIFGIVGIIIMPPDAIIDVRNNKQIVEFILDYFFNVLAILFYLLISGIRIYKSDEKKKSLKKNNTSNLHLGVISQNGNKSCQSSYKIFKKKDYKSSTGDNEISEGNENNNVHEENELDTIQEEEKIKSQINDTIPMTFKDHIPPSEFYETYHEDNIIELKPNHDKEINIINKNYRFDPEKESHKHKSINILDSSANRTHDNIIKGSDIKPEDESQLTDQANMTVLVKDDISNQFQKNIGGQEIDDEEKSPIKNCYDAAGENKYENEHYQVFDQNKEILIDSEEENNYEDDEYSDSDYSDNSEFKEKKRKKINQCFLIFGKVFHGIYKFYKKIKSFLYAYLISAYFRLDICRACSIYWIYKFSNYETIPLIFWLFFSIQADKLNKIKVATFMFAWPSILVNYYSFMVSNIENLINFSIPHNKVVILGIYGLEKFSTPSIIFCFIHFTIIAFTFLSMILETSNEQIEASIIGFSLESSKRDDHIEVKVEKKVLPSKSNDFYKNKNFFDPEKKIIEMEEKQDFRKMEKGENKNLKNSKGIDINKSIENLDKANYKEALLGTENIGYEKKDPKKAFLSNIHDFDSSKLFIFIYFLIFFILFLKN